MDADWFVWDDEGGEVWSNWICPSCGTWHELDDYKQVEETMNERSKQLVNIAHKFASDTIEYGQDFGDIMHKKLIELVIQECAELCNKEAEFAGSNGRKDASASNCADVIKKHFGVEQ